jgi:hypothetical protein
MSMWKILIRFGKYFGSSLMPVRFRRTMLETRATSYIDRAVSGGWEHPDQMADMASKDAEAAAMKKAKQGSAAEVARQEAKAESGQVDVEAQEPGDRPSRFWLVVRWIVHFLLIALILVGLYFLNQWLGLPRVLRSSWPFLHAYWLPLLFLILYLLMWLGGWLWILTGPAHVGKDYPDINQAWDLAVDMLYRSGVDIRQAPVFLVLGRTEAPANHLFGTTLRLRVTAPRGNLTPLRVYASQDRVFITVPGASVLARQARTLTQQAYENSLAGDEADVAKGTPVEGNGTPGNVNPAQAAPGSGSGLEPAAAGAEASQPQPAATAVAEPEAEPWSEEERRVLGLLQTEGMGAGSRAQKMATTFLKDPVEVRLLTSRLQYLCKLIRRDRKPYCPINGILVLVPHAALQDDVDASHTATACRHDMAVVRQTLQVQCPVFALVCDMENSDGFRQFLNRLPARHNISRLGQRFPLFPDVDEREIPPLVNAGTTWLANSLLPSLVYNLFRLETPGATRSQTITPEAALAGNVQMYQFLWELREQRKRLSRFLVRGLLMDVPRAFHFGGVYLAGTGQGASAFSSGVFLRLLQSQNFVSWTPQAVASERRYRGWAWFLFFVNLILLIGGPVVAYLFWPC